MITSKFDKNTALRDALRILNSLLSVCSCDETLHLVFKLEVVCYVCLFFCSHRFMEHTFTMLCISMPLR